MALSGICRYARFEVLNHIVTQSGVVRGAAMRLQPVHWIFDKAVNALYALHKVFMQF